MPAIQISRMNDPHIHDTVPGEYYQCKNCGQTYIHDEDLFCCGCGFKIEWME